jgi:hypothetical protein
MVVGVITAQIIIDFNCYRTKAICNRCLKACANESSTLGNNNNCSYRSDSNIIKTEIENGRSILAAKAVRWSNLC